MACGVHAARVRRYPVPVTLLVIKGHSWEGVPQLKLDDRDQRDRVCWSISASAYALFIRFTRVHQCTVSEGHILSENRVLVHCFEGKRAETAQNPSTGQRFYGSMSSPKNVSQ